MINFLQINIGEGRGAHHLMMATAAKLDVDVILVSEPNKSLCEQLDTRNTDIEGRAAIVVTGITAVEDIGPPDLGFCWIQLQGVRVYSCYWSPNRSLAEYADFLARLENSVRGSTVPVIVAGDFNAHSSNWGSQRDDAEGRMVEESMSSMDLLLCNHGGAPTFTRGISESHIDLTFASAEIYDRIEDWEVLEEESLSYHHYINFKVQNTRQNRNSDKVLDTERRWSWRKLDAKKLQTYLETAPTITGTDELTTLLKEACDACMPKGSYKGGKRPSYWWTQEIADIRKECLTARRELKRKRRNNNTVLNISERDAYKEARRKLKTAIKRSKTECWKTLCKQVDDDPWGTPYKLVTKKLVRRKPIQGITLPGRLKNIVDALFPKSIHSILPECRKTEIPPDVTCEEIKMIGLKIPTGKAPGPDGVPDIILKQLVSARPEILCGVFTRCLREGNFPDNWKVAKLVLLRKGDKPLESPSSYRPICLLDAAGKVLERILKTRLEKHLYDGNKLNEMQFGFRKGRSTTDAISKVMETVNSASTGPLRRRKLCVLVTLDVANAFNSARWDKIYEALENRDVPTYLLRIVKNYLSNRKLLYGESVVHEIECGVPQGSVLGPLLWNVMYDDLLAINLGQGHPDYSTASVIAFADDIAIIATGRDTRMLEETTNRALKAVADWMEENSLKLSINKTEAVMLTSKRGYVVPIFNLNGQRLEPKRQLRYLGVEMSKELGFKAHIRTVAAKAGKSAAALSKILPNVGGSRQKKRQLVASVVSSQLLYAAPIWASALAFDINVKFLQRPMRTMALRVASAYRTVSTAAIFVIAGMIPVHLLAKERQARQERRADGKAAHKEIREATLQSWQKEWDTATEGRWTWRLIRDVRQWTGRKHGNIDFHLTQMISGHGCFGQYLHRFKRRESPKCVDCGENKDDAEHTLFRCGRWWRQRRELEVAIQGDMYPETIVGLMLMNRENWDAVKKFVNTVLSIKEEEERIEQRRLITNS